MPPSVTRTRRPSRTPTSPARPTTYRATKHTGGGWSPTEQHISPLNGLVVHAIERTLAASDDPGTEKLISRLSFDILGPVAIDDVAVDVTVTRPGRTIELVEGVVRSGARDVLRVHAWRLAAYDTTDVSGGEPPPIPGPQELPEWPMTSVWPGGYIASLQVRRNPNSQPGRTTAWLSTALELVADEAVSPLARYIALVDTANGIAVRQPPEQWMFPNLDLTIHLHRQPVPGAVGFDTTVMFGPTGQGLTSTILHDEQGPVGHAAQVLTVRPRQTHGIARRRGAHHP
jgi:hypothetical protein